MTTPRSIAEPRRDTPVLGHYDVVVLGGGPAGIMAASAAARAGARTLLIESYGFLGGMGTAAGVTNFCGLHANVFGTIEQVVHGLADDLLARMRALGGLNEPHKVFGDRIAAQAYDNAAFKLAADALVLDSGAEILFHALAVGVVMDAARTVRALLIETKSGRQAVLGTVFIDCSGDGDLAAHAGAAFEKGTDGRGMMYPSTMFRVNGVDPVRAADTPRTIAGLMEQAEALASQHRNFEFYYFPHTGLAAGISHDLHEGPVTGKGESEDDSTLEDLKALRDSMGWSPWLRRKIIGAALPRGVVEDVSDSSYKLLATTRPIKFNEMEYHLPRANGLKGLREVIARLEKRKDVFFPMEVRFIAPDDAWLSPFRDGPRLSIAIHAAVDEPYDYFFSDIEPIHRANGGRPHWGKHHSLGHADLTALYPKFGDFLALRRELDPAGKLLNPHLAHLFGEDFDD